MKIAIFIADEGYGHAMRQKNIIHELIDHIPFVDITVFGKDKMDVLRDEFLSRIKYVDLFSLILTSKNSKGDLDVNSTKQLFFSWYQKREEWVNTAINLIDPKTDLIISDSVPQVSQVAKYYGIKQYNIQHFTWDWLYSSIYKSDEIFDRLNQDYKDWGEFLFPPLTPTENINMYPSHRVIDFIVNRRLVRLARNCDEINKKDHNKTILLMNNGTQSLTSLISQLLEFLPYQTGWKFMLRSEHLSGKDKQIALERNDVNIITGLSNTHLSIANANIIMARGGYNILSELLALKKQSIIIEEKNNPEIISNLDLASKYTNMYITKQKDTLEMLLSLIEQFKRKDNYIDKSDIKISCMGASQVLLKISSDFNLTKKYI